MVVNSVRFYYHMFGGHINTLRVIDSAGGTAWTRSGNQGNAWHGPADAFINGYTFRFEVLRGSSWQGDCAIDRVTVTCAPGPPLPPSPPPMICDNACSAADNGVCNDGGPGSEDSFCSYVILSSVVLHHSRQASLLFL